MDTKELEDQDVNSIMNTPEQFKHCNAMVQFMIDYAQKHPDVMLGTQLRACAISAAISARMCDLGDDNVADASQQLYDLFGKVYADLGGHIKAATLQ